MALLLIVGSFVLFFVSLFICLFVFPGTACTSVHQFTNTANNATLFGAGWPFDLARNNRNGDREQMQ